MLRCRECGCWRWRPHRWRGEAGDHTRHHADMPPGRSGLVVKLWPALGARNGAGKCREVQLQRGHHLDDGVGESRPGMLQCRRFHFNKQAGDAAVLFARLGRAEFEAGSQHGIARLSKCDFHLCTASQALVEAAHKSLHRGCADACLPTDYGWHEAFVQQSAQDEAVRRLQHSAAQLLAGVHGCASNGANRGASRCAGVANRPAEPT